MVFKRKLTFKFFTIKNDNKNEIIKNKTKCDLFSIFDFTHFNLGPIAIANKNGIKKGIINLL